MKLQLALVLTALVGVAADWPQFRGPAAQGTVATGDLPEKFGPEENLRWKIDLPGRGLSCPVVADGKVYLTASSGMDDTRLHVLAFDVGSGAKLWERQFWCAGPTQCHPMTCMACPTPVTDGKHVWFVFATGDVMCFTATGDLRWMRQLASEYPKMANFVGRSSSPILVGGTLAVLLENQGDSFLFGIDPATGATKWKAERPAENNWSTPLPCQRDGKSEIVVQAANGMTAYDAADGKVRWYYDEEKLNQAGSPIAVNGKVLATGYTGILMLEPGQTNASVAWKNDKLRTMYPTPLAHNGRVYLMSGSVLKCADVADGKQLWDLRINGKFWASPIFADGKLYLTGDEGKVTTVNVAEGKIIAVSDLKETLLATPAVANGALFFRSDKHLWCFSGGKKSS